MYFASFVKRFLDKKIGPLNHIIFDPKIHIINNALGTHSYVSRVQGGKLKSKNEIRISSLFKKTPEQFFGKQANPEDLAGGDREVNAKITQRILSGEKGPKRNVVVLNASAALVAAGVATDFNEGIRMAEASIDKGAAASKLEELVRFTQENG